MNAEKLKKLLKCGDGGHDYSIPELLAAAEKLKQIQLESEKLLSCDTGTEYNEQLNELLRVIEG